MYDDDDDHDTTRGLPKVLRQWGTMAQARVPGGIPTIEHDIGGDLIEVPLAIDLPAGRQMLPLREFVEALRTRPATITEKLTFHDTATLIDYVNRHRRPGTSLYLDVKSPHLTVVLDDHGGDIEEDVTTPSFGHHGAIYQFPASQELKIWQDVANARTLDQDDMAYFLEDRLHDIQTPPPDWMQLEPERLADLLAMLNLVDDPGADDAHEAGVDPEDEDAEDKVPRTALHKLRQLRFGGQHKMAILAKGISISNYTAVRTHHNTQTGERELTFTEAHGDAASTKANKKVKVPHFFLIRIPLFVDEAPRLLPVRLRYRIAGGGIKWFMDLLHADRLIRQAVKETAATVAKACDIPAYHANRLADSRTSALSYP